VVDAVPGLYFAGLIFQYSLTSDVLPNGGRDAQYLARHVASRQVTRPAIDTVGAPLPAEG
jgi:putative flavoprotein involved in K+ transport